MKFPSFLNGQSRSITSAAILIGTASLMSRLLGILRDRVLASEFGAGEVLDMYYAAFRIPDFVFNLFILGALSAGFVPLFVKIFYKNNNSENASEDSANENLNAEEGDKIEAWHFANAVINLIILSVLLVCGVLFFFAPKLVSLLTPGFSQEKIQITATLTRIMFFSPLFLGISAVFGGILQSLKKFFIYSFAPIFYNVGIILGALLLVPFFGVYGLAIGVSLGAFLHMIIQYPSVRSCGFFHEWYFGMRNRFVRTMVKIMIPRTLTLAVTQLNFFFVTILGSTLSSGSISVFSLANNLQSFPLGIFAISFSLAAFPSFSQYAASRNFSELVKSFSLTVRQILFFLIPSSVILIVLRAQIVRVILGGGMFDWNDTVLTMDTLGIFSISLFAQGLITLLVRMFYALENSMTPFFIGLVSAFFNIFLSFLFLSSYGVLGLALAFSLSSILQAMLLWIFLKLKIGSLSESEILFSVFKISVASFVLALGLQVVKTYAGLWLGTETFVDIFLQSFLSIVAGGICFIAVARFLHMEELELLIRTIKTKVFRIRPSLDLNQGREL